MAFPDDYVKESDDVVFPGSSELGDPTVVIPPVVGADMSDAKDCNRCRDLNFVRGRVSVDVFPEDQELQRKITRPLWSELLVRELPGYDCYFSGTEMRYGVGGG